MIFNMKNMLISVLLVCFVQLQCATFVAGEHENTTSTFSPFPEAEPTDTTNLTVPEAEPTAATIPPSASYETTTATTSGYKQNTTTSTNYGSTYPPPTNSAATECPPWKSVFNCASSCFNKTCPGVPGAYCIVNNCGGCFANFTDGYGNYYSEEQCRNTSVLSLTCPTTTSSCNRYSTWLCQYIKWRVDMFVTWPKAFMDWINRNAMYGHSIYFGSSCRPLFVKCRNVNQLKWIRDYFGCSIPYCQDGYYESGPDLTVWYADQETWSWLYDKWKNALDASTSSNEPGC